MAFYGLNEQDIDRIKNVFIKYKNVGKVILYGSRAKGNFKISSDIDITLIGNNLDLLTLNKIELQLDDLLLPYTFDISIFSQISNIDLVEHINRVGIIFYER